MVAMAVVVIVAMVMVVVDAAMMVVWSGHAILAAYVFSIAYS